MAPSAVRPDRQNGHHNNEKKPIFMATHPRACSTAFERVMMTRKDLSCIHEPFGDAFYFGPERIGNRYNGDSEEAIKSREESGFAATNYKDVVDQIEEEGDESGKRIFIKDITHYLLPPQSLEGKVRVAPSLRLGLNKRKGYGTSDSTIECDGPIDSHHTIGNGHSNGVSHPGYSSLSGVHPDDFDNPTVMPLSILHRYQYTFLIRHPRRSIPSYYRCTQPPLAEITGFHNFMPEEAGYRELRVFFDYVRSRGLVDDADLFVLDADDLLDAPKIAIRKYCEVVGMDFSESMLSWGHGEGCEAFDKWKGFHEDAIKSSGLKPRTHKKESKTEEQEFEEWTAKWGEDAAKVISQTIKDNEADYEYMKQFKVDLGL